MSMFASMENFGDHFQDGESFHLEDARIGKEIPTKHGPNTPVNLKIGGKWYSLFGEGIRGQVERMDSGDLPAMVRIERVPTKSGNSVKLLVPDGQQPPGQDDAFLDHS